MTRVFWGFTVFVVDFVDADVGFEGDASEPVGGVGAAVGEFRFSGGCGRFRWR